MADRLARWVVACGGIAIIVSILAILVFIVLQVWPLMSSARVTPRSEVQVSTGSSQALVVDEHLTSVVTVDPDGFARAVRLDDGRILAEKAVFPPSSGAAPRSIRGGSAGSRAVAATASDGPQVVVLPIQWQVSFDGSARRVTPEIGEAVTLDFGSGKEPVGLFSAQLSEDRQTATVAARLADGTLAVARREAAENSMTGEVTSSTTVHAVPAPEDLSALVVDREQRVIYGGSSDGRVSWWMLAGGIPVPGGSASAGPSAVTALELLLGDRALVVGQADGSLSIWFPLRQSDGNERLTRVRDFPHLPGAIRRIASSSRGKAFLAQDSGGEMGLYHSTSHRTLWRGHSPLPETTALAYSPKADGLLLAGSGRLALFEVDCPHPEISLAALFGKVWYESYPGPAHVWQSTGGTEDFEPKLSLTPLLFGTFKGTFFALVLAIPLGVLSAMYASQFMHPSLRRYIKPIVEIMAALPSVVLGFLAGLWLAPRLESIVPALVPMPLVLPVLVLAAGFLWKGLPRGLRARFPSGIESIVFVFVIVAGVAFCLSCNHWFEGMLFGGDFQSWLLTQTGLRYDQRNAIVVGLAMGFAVIPIIFAISEDAFSNVPRNLTSGSLALGATRWQTVIRVVLPSASPGIFAAIMVGFGRAVGETMIVLMATGNTPIMEWSPFNGFRTLSANIAVEIAEAPHNGTLYRTLFLAALLLFALTFIVNTAAEVVRQRLRRRYSDL